MTQTFTITHRSLGVVQVKKILTQPTGLVRVEVIDGMDKGCSFVVSPEALKS